MKEGVDLEATLFEHLPETFFRRAVDMVFDGHRRAHDAAYSQYAAAEAKNFRPYAKRANVETGLGAVADLHESDGVTHRAVAGGGNWNHREVTAGPVVLTCASTRTPCGLLPAAGYRLELAATTNGTLLDIEGERVYAMLLHSNYHPKNADDAHKFGHLPGSCYLAFPEPDLKSYMHEINLFDRYPDTVKAQLPPEWDDAAVVGYLFNARKSSWRGAA